MYLKTENVTGSTKRSAVWARWKTLDTPEAIRKGIRTQLKEQSSYTFAFGGYSRKIILRQTLSSLYRLSLSTLRSASIDKSVYLIQNGADRFSFIFFRGFGTGAMHVLCGLIVGGRKMVRFPLIAEEITEYSLLESCFLAALKFF